MEDYREQREPPAPAAQRPARLTSVNQKSRAPGIRMAAASYFDRRQDWWMEWPRAKRDHDSFCVSCLTAVPYALSRPALRNALAEHEAHPDFFIFDSLPGAGAVMAPRLLAAFGSQRERYQNAAEVQTLSGIAPVSENSGKSRWVHFHFACSKFLRQSFHEFAAHSILQSQWARAYYELQRRRGKMHHAAVRALAFKRARIIYRCWNERVAYDENVYLAASAKRNSPLVAATKAGAVAL
jgi:Transposase IS116/IS110/IS902 family